MQVQYVTHCLQFGHLKSAARAVKDFGLQQEFPDVEATYKRKTLDRLVGKGLWGVAATYVGDDQALQVRPAAAGLRPWRIVVRRRFVWACLSKG